MRIGNHTHNFTYSATGDTITATCDADGCPLPVVAGTPTATLTIKAPSTDGGAAVLEADPQDAFEDLSASVKYQTKNGSMWSSETATAPTQPGIHRASITLGNATASVAYGMNCITYATGLLNGSISGATGATCGATVTPTITPAVGYQLDTLTVTPAADSGVSASDVSVDGGTFVMPEANVTVSATFKEVSYTVTVDGAKATVTEDVAEPRSYTAELTGLPSDKTYDGEPVNLTATVNKSEGFPSKIAVGNVTFKDENNNVVTTATNVGTYTASATVGDKTISKTFSINGRIPSVTYVEAAISNNKLVITRTTTNQYIPLLSNPYGITFLKDGRTYVARGNVEIGALIYTGDVKLVLCKNTTVTVYAGIYHIGSSLNIYAEEGGEESELIIKGNKALDGLDNYADFDPQEIEDADSSLSGTIRVEGGKLIVEQGNTNLVADDISLTAGVLEVVKGTKGDSEPVYLTGGQKNRDGSVTYNKSNLEGLTKLLVEYKLPATVTTAPKAKTLTYTGHAQVLVTKGTAKDGSMKYAVTTVKKAPDAGAYAFNNSSLPTATKAGTYYVWYKAAGDDSHVDSEPAFVTATVGKANLSKAKVTLKKTRYSYDGKAKKAKVKSVVLGGKMLKAGTDYTVSYKNNKKLGTAIATITGKGNYKGSAKATFKIVLAKVRGLSTAAHQATGTLDVRWKAVAGANSYKLSWCAAGGKWKSKSVKGTSATVKGLKDGGLYEVRVCAKAGSATGEWSKSYGRWLRKVSSIKAAAGSTKGSIKVSWAADAEATGGYVAYACAKKDGAIVAKKAVDAGETSATIKGLKPGRAYYVRARPLRKSSGSTYVGVLRYCKTTVKAK